MVKTYWERSSNGKTMRLVREWLNAAGQVDRWEVVTSYEVC